MDAPSSSTPYLFRGSSPQVPNCCYKCGVATTSGCWRRGWEIAAGSVNLCNRCGLKYKKQNGSFEEAHLDQAADTPGPASQHGLPYFPAPGSRARQIKQDADHPAEERSSKRRTSKRQHSLNMDDFLSDDDDLSEQATTPAMPDLPPVDPEIKARDFSPVELSLTTFVMRRISCSARATYIIFWVQDKNNESYISVVGADYKGTGHFIYNNAPSYNVPDGLHVTNRNEATNWVISQGALLAAPDPEGKYIDLDLHDVELIKSGLSLWPKPEFDKPYNSYKVITDGKGGSEDEAKPSSFKIVLEEEGTENTCVAVSSSAGDDGSLVLTAADEFGGMSLESTEEAEEWVKYILGLSPGPDGPIKLSTILRFQHAKGDKLPLPDLPFSTARPVPRPARIDKAKLRSSTGMKMRHSVINGKFKQCAHCGGLGHDGRSCPMRPGGPNALPHFEMAEGLTYRDHLDVRPHQDVMTNFEAFPELLEFIVWTPDFSLVETVRGYAKTLSGFVDDEEPKEPILNNNGAPMEWVPTTKALEIIKDLEQMKVSLKLLEASGVPRPLARLRTHGNPEVSAIATKVTETWKSLARRVASHCKACGVTA